SIRHAQTVRVYLERPWYASGADELLGVVMLGGPVDSDEVRHRYGHFVSQWARDPIYASAWDRGTLTPQMFPTAVRLQRNLTLPQFGSEPAFCVAGFPVHYAIDRDLYYADVTIDAGNSPAMMVRLALARYQPYSIQDAEGDVSLSTPVLLDWALVHP